MALRDRLKKALTRPLKAGLTRVLKPTGPQEAPAPREWARRDPWDRPDAEGALNVDLAPPGTVEAQEAIAARATPGSTDVDARPLPAPAPIPTFEDVDALPTLETMPGSVHPTQATDAANPHRISCGYCGVGDSGHVSQRGRKQRDELGPRVRVDKRAPTPGCVKIQEAGGKGRPFWPFHSQPSVLDPATGQRIPISYEEAIARLSDHVLAHREPDSQVLVYGCGQIDYFTIFALQEVFRLLGVRNLGGNAEHCLNAGAVHNEMLTGQEGPFLTIEQALRGGTFFVLNGWNGRITHPGVWNPLLARDDFDGYLVDVMWSESAAQLGERLGEDRVLLIKAGSDPHLALSVAHVLLTEHAGAVDKRFVDRFASGASWRAYRDLAREERFAPQAVAERIAPEPELVDRIERGIRGIAAGFAAEDAVPVNIPSVGLSQSKGAVSHCLWGSALAMLGRYGLFPDGSPRGGVLRVPGQINAESEIQGLSRLFFFGRIPVDLDGMVDAARRMGLPDDAYELAERDEPRATLDYSDPSTRADRELFVCFGTQFEANLMERQRWIKKLQDPDSTLVVVDPVPDPFTLAHADLIIPSPPHPAASKLYQNGEWRLTLSVPWKQAPAQTRSDPTILYDVMAEISRRIRTDSILRMIHPDLGYHSQTGYLRERFEDTSVGGGLPRIDGEVSRAHLWQRVLDYLDDGEDRRGRLYCYPTRDGRAVSWGELVEEGNLVYGGVGTTRYVLDYDDPDAQPYGDLFGERVAFEFFVPTAGDLAIPAGTILNSGRSALSDDPKAIAFATATFNSGKATARAGMPDHNPLCVGPRFAEEHGLVDGQTARVTSVETGASLQLPVRVTDRVVGDAAYVSFHKSRAQVEDGVYVNELTSHSGRCPYTSQTNFKVTRVRIQPVETR